MFHLNFVANTLGILSLIASIAVVFPTVINIFKITFARKRLTLQISYLGLLLAITLGLIHGLLMTQRIDINFYNLETYWEYAVGLFVFNLFVFLAFVFPQLKSDIKKLNYLNYAVLLLLTCHIGQKIFL